MSRPNLRLRFDHFRNDPSAQLLHEAKSPTSAVDYYRTWKQWANETVRDGVLGFVQPSPRLLRRRESDVTDNGVEEGEAVEGGAVPQQTGLGIQGGGEAGGEELAAPPEQGGEAAGGEELAAPPEQGGEAAGGEELAAPPEQGGEAAGGEEVGTTAGGRTDGEAPVPDDGDTATEQPQRRRKRRSYLFAIATTVLVTYLMRKIQQHGELVFAPDQTPWIPVREIALLPPHCAVAEDVTELIATFLNDTHRGITLGYLPSLGPPSPRYRGWFDPKVYSEIVKRDCPVLQYPPVDLTRHYGLLLEQTTATAGKALQEELATRARELDWIKRLIGGIDRRMANSNPDGSASRTKDDPFKIHNAIMNMLQGYLANELSVLGSAQNVSDELFSIHGSAVSLRNAAITIASRAEKAKLEDFYKYEIDRRNGLLPGMLYAFLQHFSNEAPLETRCADYDLRQLRQVVASSLFVEGMINATLAARYEVREKLLPAHDIFRENQRSFEEDRARPVTTPQAYMDAHRATLTKEIHEAFNYVDRVVTVDPQVFRVKAAEKWVQATFGQCVVEDSYVFEDEIPITRLRQPVTFWEKWQEDKGKYGAVVRHAHEKKAEVSTAEEL